MNANDYFKMRKEGQELSICVGLLWEIGTELFSLVWTKYNTEVLGWSNLKREWRNLIHGFKSPPVISPGHS